MRREDILEWFESLDAKSNAVQCKPHTEAVRAWNAEAYSAIAAVFPRSHPIFECWKRLEDKVPNNIYKQYYEDFVGVFKGALSQVRKDRIGTLVDAIREEAEADLLDQADALLAYPSAAAVIAGGALETHLRHLVNKHGLAFAGEGSISKYDAAIAQARNAGNQIYSANVGKLVTSWGGIRNDAAHDPGNFKWSKDDVRRMIEGVRDFIERTA